MTYVFIGVPNHVQSHSTTLSRLRRWSPLFWIKIEINQENHSTSIMPPKYVRHSVSQLNNLRKPVNNQHNSKLGNSQDNSKLCNNQQNTTWSHKAEIPEPTLKLANSSLYVHDFSIKLKPWISPATFFQVVLTSPANQRCMAWAWPRPTWWPPRPSPPSPRAATPADPPCIEVAARGWMEITEILGRPYSDFDRKKWV